MCMLLFLWHMENADSIKIEKFKSIKDFQLSSEQQSTKSKESKRNTIANNNCFFLFKSLSQWRFNPLNSPIDYASVFTSVCYTLLYVPRSTSNSN